MNKNTNKAKRNYRDYRFVSDMDRFFTSYYSHRSNRKSIKSNKKR